MTGITRSQTEAEKDLTPTGTDGNTTGFIPIAGPDRKMTTEELFTRTLQKHEQEATKSGLPFARHIAREDFKDNIEMWERTWKKQGYVKDSKPKVDEIDWKKYYDLKNFEVIIEKEKNDEHLTARYKVPVYIKTIKYKWKGDRRYTYTVQEDGMKAVQRALK